MRLVAMTQYWLLNESDQVELSVELWINKVFLMEKSYIGIMVSVKNEYPILFIFHFVSHGENWTIVQYPLYPSDLPISKCLQYYAIIWGKMKSMSNRGGNGILLLLYDFLRIDQVFLLCHTFCYFKGYEVWGAFVTNAGLKCLSLFHVMQ